VPHGLRTCWGISQDPLHLFFVESLDRTRINADLRCGRHHVSERDVRLPARPFKHHPFVLQQVKIRFQEAVVHLSFFLHDLRGELLNIFIMC
jgi:hypothetical protein